MTHEDAKLIADALWSVANAIRGLGITLMIAMLTREFIKWMLK